MKSSAKRLFHNTRQLALLSVEEHENLLTDAKRNFAITKSSVALSAVESRSISASTRSKSFRSMSFDLSKSWKRGKEPTKSQLSFSVLLSEPNTLISRLDVLDERCGVICFAYDSKA